MNGKEFVEMLDKYSSGQLWLNDVDVEIEGGEGPVEPLVLLRAYEKQTDLTTKVELAQLFCMNKKVVFKRKDKEVLAFVYTGGDISKYFASAPYLLDILLNMSVGLMLKKLTPPSDTSATEERQ
mgnify:CR=1 FL=1